jgi:hypothetical protein
LAANALVALMIKRTNGFNSTFAITDLILFYASRPRLSWFFIGLLQPLPNKVYDSSARQGLIAEVILQIIATYYVGRTVHFASTHGYYKPHADYQFQHGGAARMMYGGALFYLLAIAFNFYNVVATNTWRKPDRKVTNYGAGGSASVEQLTMLAYVIWTGFTTWIGSWLFWAGYVRLAGDL